MQSTTETNPVNSAEIRLTSSEVDTALCVWEEMLDRQRMGDQQEWAAPMLEMWEDRGSCEMRELAVTIGKVIEQAWCSLNEGQQDDCAPFDWEFVPKAVSLLDWANDTPNDVEPSVLARRTMIAINGQQGSRFNHAKFNIVQTGGGRSAWGKAYPEGFYVWISSGDDYTSHVRGEDDWLVVLRDVRHEIVSEEYAGSVSDALEAAEKMAGTAIVAASKAAKKPTPHEAAIGRIRARLKGEWFDPHGDLESDIMGVLRELDGSDEAQPENPFDPESPEGRAWDHGDLNPDGSLKECSSTSLGSNITGDV